MNLNKITTNETMQSLSDDKKKHRKTIISHYFPKELSISKLYPISGFIIYCIIFVIIIPYLLLKNDNYTFLEAYLPNLDLVANLLTYRGGPLGNNLFRELYMSNPVSTSSFVQKTIINYFALLGLTFIIARETIINKSIEQGWSIGFIMILMTYLLPSRFINYIMDQVYSVFSSDVNSSNYDLKGYVPALLVGLIITILIINFEKLIIKYNKVKLTNLATFLIEFAKNI